MFLLNSHYLAWLRSNKGLSPLFINYFCFIHFVDIIKNRKDKSNLFKNRVIYKIASRKENNFTIYISEYKNYVNL